MIWIFTRISAADPEEETTQICHKLFPPTPLRLQGCISVLQGCISLLSTSGPGPTILHPECRHRAREDPHSLNLHEPAQAAWLQGGCNVHPFSIFVNKLTRLSLGKFIWHSLILYIFRTEWCWRGNWSKPLSQTQALNSVKRSNMTLLRSRVQTPRESDKYLK